MFKYLFNKEHREQQEKGWDSHEHYENNGVENKFNFELSTIVTRDVVNTLFTEYKQITHSWDKNNQFQEVDLATAIEETSKDNTFIYDFFTEEEFEEYDELIYHTETISFLKDKLLRVIDEKNQDSLREVIQFIQDLQMELYADDWRVDMLSILNHCSYWSW